MKTSSSEVVEPIPADIDHSCETDPEVDLVLRQMLSDRNNGVSLVDTLINQATKGHSFNGNL